MPLQIIRADITKLKVDAIVNAANETLLGDGGVSGAIHLAAGRELAEECKALGGCKTGEAKITKGYKLSAKYVIHAVGPIWSGGGQGEEKLLFSCYKRALELARDNKCASIAFPLISSGIFGYPKDRALRVAIDAISAFLAADEMQVYIVVFDKKAYQISSKLFNDIKAYVDDCYVEQTGYDSRDRRRILTAPQVGVDSEALCDEACHVIDKLVDCLDESFSEMLLRKIDERGITDAACYKKANVDRKLFSKIRSNGNYHPSKQTALAFAVALQLSLKETSELLLKAGFALSHSSKADIIVEYFIKNGKYDINEINEALFAFDQKLLGL